MHEPILVDESHLPACAMIVHTKNSTYRLGVRNDDGFRTITKDGDESKDINAICQILNLEKGEFLLAKIFYPNKRIKSLTTSIVFGIEYLKTDTK